jgi:cell wall-associated NlpC family hydrolase
MNTVKKICYAAMCSLLLSLSVNTQAKSQHSSNDIQQAYNKYVISKQTNSQRSPSRLQNNNVRSRVLKTAKQQLHKKYRWGGSTPRRGFDCSGLVQYAYKSVNIKLPRTAAQQYRSTKRISMSRLKMGDLIFFNTRRSRSRVNHVGIYLGGGNFIHAPRRGKRVSVSKLDKYWQRKVIGAGRV